MIDAFKESIKTKDELILKFYDNSDTNSTNAAPIQFRKITLSVEEGFI